MRKIWVVAGREYAAAVKSKAFLVSLVVMPLLMFGGIFVQKQTAKMGDVKPKRIAVVDRSPGGELVGALQASAEMRNSMQLIDPKTGKQMKPRIEIEKIEPGAADDEQALLQQRFELSERIRKGVLFAYLEIGPDVLNPKIRASTTQAAARVQSDEMKFLQTLTLADDVIGEENGAAYATNRPTNSDVRNFLQNSLNAAVYTRRASPMNVTLPQLQELLTPAKLITHGLTKRGTDGNINSSTRENEVIALLIPIGLLMLMFIVVMVGASPLTVNLVEEKQLKIAEVLLGSLRPFELMMGKLLGGVGVALTLAVVYFAGVYYFAHTQGVLDVLTPWVITWFMIYTVLATMMYGAMFLAAGSAVTNVKEAQSMLMPVMVLIVIPMFFLESLLRDPSGIVPTVGSLFPTSAPMMTVARLAIPPGMSGMQLVMSAAATLLTTIAVVWAAGRIFRVGILMQGQGAKPMEMLKWIVRG